MAPDLRGRGIARLLLVRLCSMLSGRNAESLFLEVNAGNQAARGLYETTGFSIVGERTAYYQGEVGRQDALIMKRILKAGR